MPTITLQALAAAVSNEQPIEQSNKLDHGAFEAYLSDYATEQRHIKKDS